MVENNKQLPTATNYRNHTLSSATVLSSYKRFLAHSLPSTGLLMSRLLALYVSLYWTYSNYPNLARHKSLPRGHQVTHSSANT
jgi:hypothetical protein